jgi:hypothetical protein
MTTPTTGRLLDIGVSGREREGAVDEDVNVLQEILTTTNKKREVG